MNERELSGPVLALLEGSEEEDGLVLRQARRLAGDEGVVLLRVRPLAKRSVPGETLAAPRLSPFEQMRAQEAHDRHQLRRFAGPRFGTLTPLEVRFGDPVDETRAVAAERGAVMVVAASRPGGFFRRGRDGRLARELHVPVLLVTPEPEAPSPTPRLAHQP